MIPSWSGMFTYFTSKKKNVIFKKPEKKSKEENSQETEEHTSKNRIKYRHLKTFFN